MADRIIRGNRTYLEKFLPHSRLRSHACATYNTILLRVSAI